ncbi:MAG: ribonuclease HII [Fimbriimonadaceae bacterium]|nr:ribonuclease HII [Fimbriimonadaceae bacterium]
MILEPDVIGVDEAGRGALAGPVVVAAVRLPAGFDIAGLNDSKKLTPARREIQASRIRAGAVWSIVEVGLEEIESLNILWAAMAGMRRAALAIPGEGRIRVDGDRLPELDQRPAEAWVKGDSRCPAIAAASILAKTHRDSLMLRAAEKHPGYGFEAHFGYGVPEHLDSLARLGPCPIHRRGFEPIRSMREQPCLNLDI